MAILYLAPASILSVFTMASLRRVCCCKPSLLVLRYRVDREVHDLEELTLSLVHTGESYEILSPVYLPQLEDLVADVLYEDDEHWM